jgi:23S rRNA (guanosine2251-2'-O)-methyltransferase
MHMAHAKPRKRRIRRPFARSGSAGQRHKSQVRESTPLYGLHAVEAALANPRRTVTKVLATENAAHRLGPLLAKRGLTPEAATPRDLDRLLGSDAVHQGVALEVEPLPPVALDDVDPTGMLLVLDQVTDPHNVGAVLRSAAAFGAAGLIMTERHSPPLHGALAKAASGALDLVPVFLVKNLAQSLAQLGERGFLRVGLAEEGAEALETASLTRPLALVLGAEGRGLRQLTREHCDLVCRISTQNALESLNVSNAAAVALHWASRTAR